MTLQRDVNSLTSKQFGDACEHAVLAELMLAGWAAHKMPDNWRGYDLMVHEERNKGRAAKKMTVKGLVARFNESERI